MDAQSLYNDQPYDADEDDDFFADPEMFDRDSMRAIYPRQFNKYIDLRVMGIRSDIAFTYCFPKYSQPHDKMVARQRIAFLEASNWFIDTFNAQLAAAKVEVMWNPNKAVNRFLSVLEDPDSKDSARIAAAKELNVLAGITTIDDAGRTRKARTLEDFYADMEPDSAEARIAKQESDDWAKSRGWKGPGETPTPH